MFSKTLSLIFKFAAFVVFSLSYRDSLNTGSISFTVMNREVVLFV